MSVFINFDIIYLSNKIVAIATVFGATIIAKVLIKVKKKVLINKKDFQKVMRLPTIFKREKPRKRSVFKALDGAVNKDKSDPHHRVMRFGFLLSPPDSWGRQLAADASVHDETNQKLKLKPDSIRDA